MRIPLFSVSLAALLLPSLILAHPAQATAAPPAAPPSPPTPVGAVWRTLDPPRPAVGPAELVVTKASLASVLDGKRKASQTAPAPQVEVLVMRPNGTPAPGVEVRAWLRGPKKGSKAIGLKGATDSTGRFRLRPDASMALMRVALDLAWDDGYRVVAVTLEPASGKWSMTRAPYKDPISDNAHGSCANLFTVERLAARADGVPSVRITARLPETLLSCDSVDYGAERKSDQVARIHEIGSRDINAGDKNFYSEGDEDKLGIEAADHFDKELEILDDPAIHAYVRSVMDRVVAASDDPTMITKVRVVHTDDINAFCTLGGNIYVFTGLIKAAQNESMLAGVLAHEFSHAVARHVTEGATRQAKAQMGTQLGATIAAAALGLGSAGTDAAVKASSTAAGILGLKYDRRFEAEADLLGEQYLWKAGWDPESIARFFELLQARDESAAVPGWLSTHPTHANRIRTGITWARTFLPEKERYLVDTAAFQDCKRRVAALPPPKKKSAPPTAPPAK